MHLFGVEEGANRTGSRDRIEVRSLQAAKKKQVERKKGRSVRAEVWQ